MTSKRIRVLVCDDEGPMRVYLRAALTAADIEVVGEAADGATAITLAGALQPDLILLDLVMPVLDGVSALPQILASAPEAKVVVFSALPAREMQEQLLEMGAHLYLQKGGSPSDLLLAVREAMHASEDQRVVQAVWS